MSDRTHTARVIPPFKVLLSIAETITATGMGKSFVYAEIRSGRLRSVMAGKRRMIPADALAEWVASLPPGTPGPVKSLSRTADGAR
jgi:excisionase family DNA binding protein